VFPTTRGSALAGLKSTDSQVRRRSWDAIANAYYKPVYRHLRLRWRRSPEDAADLSQGFFAHMVEGDGLASFEPSRGRFRTYVRSCLDHFAQNEVKAAARLKRGGGRLVVPLDLEAVEAEITLSSGRESSTFEEAFDREWRRAVMSRAIQSLKAALVAEGREAHYHLFERYDLCEAEPRPTYEALGRDLGLPVTTVTNRLAHARKELRRHLRSELEAIVISDTELDEEWRALLGPGR
jgi:RNA polymerase sigma factor (sigma-70 family)